MSLARQIKRRMEKEATGAVNSCPKCHKTLDKKPADDGTLIKVCSNCGWVQKGYYARVVEDKNDK